MERLLHPNRKVLRSQRPGLQMTNVIHSNKSVSQLLLVGVVGNNIKPDIK